MFTRLRAGDVDVAILERVEQIVRRHFALGDDQIVLVSEEESRLPGGPRTMTTILFWSGPEKRYKVRVFKPAVEVAITDLPAAWLVQAILDDGLEECC